jgi:hypothetical protein
MQKEYPGTFDEFVDPPQTGQDGNGLPADTDAPATRFRLIPFRQLTPRNVRRYLVKTLMPSTGLIVVWGPPKCGKSFWTFDLVMHVALNWEYRGRRVSSGAIVYCAFEGAEGFKARAAAFRKHHGLADDADVSFFLIDAMMDLIADHGALIHSIKATLGDVQPAAVVLDTLNRSLRGSESSDEDMADYVRAADAIKEAFGCAVVIVHHCGHDDKRPRGHSSLMGAVDAQIAVIRDTGNNIVATVERMKDGEEGAAVASRLEQVEVGIDEDGDAITSCVIVATEGHEPKANDKVARLPKAARIAARALQEAVNDAGEIPPASNHIPPHARAVKMDLWRQYSYARGISDSQETRAQQQAFKRGSEALIAAQVVAVWQPYVWTVR